LEKKPAPKKCVDEIRQLMSDGRPRNLPEIRNALPRFNEKTICSTITRLWRQQRQLLASQLVSAYSLHEFAPNKFRWSRQKLRWYIAAKDQEPTSVKVQFVSYDKKLGRNVEVVKLLTFTSADEVKDSQKNGNIEKVLNHIKQSSIALFPGEVAKQVEIKPKQATSALTTLYLRKKVQRIGQVNRSTGEEGPYDKGWLYYVDRPQAEQRLCMRDVLSGKKQEIYDFISIRTNNQRSMTRAKAIMQRFDLMRYTKITEVMDEIIAAYPELEKESINNETFYYIKDVLSEEELTRQREFWRNQGQKRSSFHTVLGRAHESLVQIGIDRMWEAEAFRIANYRWEFSIEHKTGRKKYNKYYQRVRESGKRWEFDRILHCSLAPFSEKGNNEIILVFEMKYRGKLDLDLWEAFLYKLADTWTFGYDAKVRTMEGIKVSTRLKKHNVIPVMVVPWAGKDDIEMVVGGQMKKVNFAQYVLSQGGILLYTNEFERYLSENTGKPVSFQKMFKSWWAEKQAQKIDDIHEEEFTQLLVNYLFRQGPNIEKAPQGSSIKERPVALPRQ
jgi:hypothetical protein